MASFRLASSLMADSPAEPISATRVLPERLALAPEQQVLPGRLVLPERLAPVPERLALLVLVRPSRCMRRRAPDGTLLLPLRRSGGAVLV